MMRELYMVRSSKAQEWENGLRKVSFASDDPEIYAFVWLDTLEQLQSIQIILREQVLEWDRQSGTSQSETNRQALWDDPESQKGSRSLHNQQAQLGTLEREQLQNCLFPQAWDTLIKSCFNVLDPSH